MHEVKVSVAAANLKAEAFARAMAGGQVGLYMGPKPATADASLGSAVLLARGVFGEPAFAAASKGMVVANITSDASARAAGKPNFYRLLSKAGVPMGDGTVGPEGSGSDMEMKTDYVVQFAEVRFAFKHQERME